MSENHYVTLSHNLHNPVGGRDSTEVHQDDSGSDAKDLNQAVRIARWFLIIVVLYIIYAFVLNIFVLYKTQSPVFRIDISPPLNVERDTVLYAHFEWKNTPAEGSKIRANSMTPLIMFQGKEFNSGDKNRKINLGSTNTLQIMPRKNLPTGEYRGKLVFEQYYGDANEPVATYPFPVVFDFSAGFWPSWAVVIVLVAIVLFAYMIFMLFGALIFPRATGRLKVQKVCRVNEFPDEWESPIKPSRFYLLWPPLKSSVSLRSIMNRKKFNKLKLPAFFLFTIPGYSPFLRFKTTASRMPGEVRKMNLPEGPYQLKYDDFNKCEQVVNLVNMRKSQVIFFKLKNGTIYSLRYKDK